MRTYKKILILFGVLSAVLYLIFFIWIRPTLGRDIVLNQTIPAEANTISALIKIADSHMNKYLKGHGYHVGSILMELNLEHEGDVRITFVNERSGGIPDVYTVYFDTEINQLIEINKLFREDKNNPGNLYFDSWNITDKEAYQIALEAFNESGESFEFENYNLLASAVVQPSWWVVFYTKENIFRVRINGISGEVISAGD